MAFTLEAALVFPLSFSLILGLVPPAVRNYRAIGLEASARRQAVRLNADPASIYALSRVAGKAAGPGTAGASAASDVLLTSPKLMFSLVTAVLDDLEILGLTPP